MDDKKHESEADNILKISSGSRREDCRCPFQEDYKIPTTNIRFQRQKKKKEKKEIKIIWVHICTTDQVHRTTASDGLAHPFQFLCFGDTTRVPRPPTSC